MFLINLNSWLSWFWISAAIFRKDTFMSADNEALKKNILDLVLDLEPEEALDAFSGALREVLSRLEDEQRVKFVLALLEKGDEDKISSMVHL